MLHPLPLPLSSCLGCIPPLIGLPSLRFYAVGSSLFLLSVCFCLCSLFYRDDVLCWLLLARPFLYAFHAHLRFPVDLVWFRLSCDHGWIRSGSVNVRKQQQQQLCKDFSLLSVLVSIIILHVSYQLFWWFHSIFCLKVCAVISCLCATEYSADRFPTRTIKLPMYYGVALIDFYPVLIIGICH